jgi:hypothetical protein
MRVTISKAVLESRGLRVHTFRYERSTETLEVDATALGEGASGLMPVEGIKRAICSAHGLKMDDANRIVESMLDKLDRDIVIAVMAEC